MLTKSLEKIERNHPSVIQLGLERVQQVASKLNLLEFDCPVVTVAGTNGKGSTTTALAKLMQNSGKKCGTYTSPHLICFEERIRINGECLSEERLCEAFQLIEDSSLGIALTYFEFTTLAALSIFQQEKLDLLILEVGLGGRLDAVNAVSPDLAIITSISFDHEEWLGNTLTDIAREKAGILRPMIPVILSHEASLPVVLEKMEGYQNIRWLENDDFQMTQAQWECKKTNTIIDVPKNSLPINSVSLAMAAYTILMNKLVGLPSLEKAVVNLKGVGMIGRFHTMEYGEKRYIFDVAHNPGGTTWLSNKLTDRKNKGRYIAIWASLKDKSLAKLIDPLVKLMDSWFICDLSGTPRATPVKELREVLESKGIASVNDYSSLEEALNAAKQVAKPNDEIVVFGSFFTVAKAYEALGLQAVTLVEYGLHHE